MKFSSIQNGLKTAFCATAALAALTSIVGIVGTAGIVGTTLAHADSVERLIEVSSDAYPNDLYHFSVGTDDSGDVVSFGYAEGTQAPTQYTLDQVRAGVVLMHNDNPSRDVIILKLDSAFSGKDGGKVVLEYLINGLRPHSYGAFNIDLVRGGTTWLPYSYDRSGSRSDRPFGRMRFVANRLFGKVVGVSYIQTQ